MAAAGVADEYPGWRLVPRLAEPLPPFGLDFIPRAMQPAALEGVGEHKLCCACTSYALRPMPAMSFKNGRIPQSKSMLQQQQPDNRAVPLAWHLCYSFLRTGSLQPA
jgi:hypothetical protein